MAKRGEAKAEGKAVPKPSLAGKAAGLTMPPPTKAPSRSAPAAPKPLVGIVQPGLLPLPPKEPPLPPPVETPRETPTSWSRRSRRQKRQEPVIDPQTSTYRVHGTDHETGFSMPHECTLAEATELMEDQQITMPVLVRASRQ